MTALSARLDSIEREIDRLRVHGGVAVASLPDDVPDLLAAFKAAWPGRGPIVIVTGIPLADSAEQARG